MKMNFALVSLLLLSPHAQASSPLLSDLAELVNRCSVQPFSLDAAGHEVDGDPVSICPELVVHGKRALITIDGVKLRADLKVSIQSDGDDLGNLEVRDQYGTVVESFDNILAFGSVLNALALGHTDSFRKIQR